MERLLPVLLRKTTAIYRECSVMHCQLSNTTFVRMQCWLTFVISKSTTKISLSHIEIWNLNMGYLITVMTSHKHHGISKNCQLNCLFSSLFKLTSKETPKLHIIGSL